MDEQTITALLESIKAKATSDRFEKGFNTLLELSKTQPELLYPGTQTLIFRDMGL